MSKSKSNCTFGKVAGLLIRLTIGALILILLLKRISHQDLSGAIAEALRNWPWLLVALVCVFLGLFMGSIRWKIILSSLGFRASMLRIFQIFFIGQFFNSFLLGACGGDLARAYFITRDQPRRKTESATTVLVDRAIGLLTFIIVGCIMVMLRGSILYNATGSCWPAFMMGLFLVFSLAGLFVIFRRNLFERWRVFRRLEARTRIGGVMRKTYEVFFFYRQHPRTMASCAGLSFMNLFFLTSACYFFGQSLSIESYFINYLTIFPIVTVFTAVPITPGGFGIREGLFAELFGGVGVPIFQAVPLSLLMYAGGLIWSLFGGLMFIIYKSGTDIPTGSMLKEISEEKDALYS